MNPEKNREELEKFLDMQLFHLKKFVVSDENVVMYVPIKDFIKLNKPDHSMEFICLGRKFIIDKEIHPFNKIAFLRTYELVLDHSNYPNIRLEHIQEMDVYLNLSRGTDFRLMYYSEISQNQQALIIENFDLQYSRHLFYQLRTLENKMLNPQ